MIRRRILLGVLLTTFFGVGWGVGRGRAGGDLYRNLDTFVEVLHAVQTSYVDPVEPRPLIEGGLHGLLRALDPYSDYLTPREVEAQSATLEEEFAGAGLYLDEHQGVPVVVAPIEGSPAWEAGVLPGDMIVRVDGHSTFGIGLAEMAARLHGEPGTSLVLVVARPGEPEERTITLARRAVPTPSVPYAFVSEPGIGYVRIARFGERAGDEVAAAIDTLRTAGARSLVIDLRDNPGGLVDQAILAVAPLLPAGALVVTTKGRVVAPHPWPAPKARARMDGPVAVLVDGGTASAAEIVAGALQDHDRALVVGESTFGKGTVQEYYPLRNHEGALRLTTAWYYTPSGRRLQRGGPAAPTTEDDSGDAPDDSSASGAADDSSAARAAFRTDAGRVVHSGNVDPDLEVAPDSLGPVARAIEGRRLAFAFAGAWVAAHGATVDDAAVGGFRAAVAKAGVTLSDATWAADGAAIRRALGREFARRAGGGAAAARVALASDPVYARAAAVLRRAQAPGDVFALAAGRTPAPAARAAGRKGR